MVLNVLGVGIGGGARVVTLTRAIIHLRFRASMRFAQVRERCDRALRAWAARRLVREMQAWPDERLRDIGLTRADLAGAIEGVRRPFRWQPESEGARIDAARFGH